MDTVRKSGSDKCAATKRANNYAIAAAFALIFSVTWLTSRSGGSACLGGACAAAWFTQPAPPGAAAKWRQPIVRTQNSRDEAMPSAEGTESPPGDYEPL